MYLEFSHCPEEQRIGATAMPLEGAAMTWYNGIKQQVTSNVHADWANYTEFRDELLNAFEPMSEIGRARTAIRNLRKMGRITGYIQKFRDLQFQIPDMPNPEAILSFCCWIESRDKNTNWNTCRLAMTWKEQLQ